MCSPTSLSEVKNLFINWLSAPCNEWLLLKVSFSLIMSLLSKFVERPIQWNKKKRNSYFCMFKCLKFNFCLFVCLLCFFWCKCMYFFFIFLITKISWMMTFHVQIQESIKLKRVKKKRMYKEDNNEKSWAPTVVINKFPFSNLKCPPVVSLLLGDKTQLAF